MSITAYKGFDKDFKCRGFQYEVGKTYEHDGEVRACAKGFHACENPFDVWNYYGPIDARFAAVELDGDTDRESNGDSKIAAGKITISAEISAGGFTKKCVQWLVDLTKGKSEDGDSAQLAASGDSAQLAASGDYAQLAASGHSAKLAASGGSAKLAASGDYAQLAASGHSAKLAASGDYAQLAASGGSAKLAASGDYAQLAASGYSAKLAASGDYAKLAASGHSAQLAASGYSAQLAASGDYAKLAASGDYAQLAASGKNSVIASSSIYSTAKGAPGTWISLAEFVDGKCVGFAIGCIGQDGLKPDTPYRAIGGKLVEAAE